MKYKLPKEDEIIREIINRVTGGQVLKRSRETVHVQARQFYFKIATDLLRRPVNRVTKMIGFNHATGLHHIKNFDNYYQTERDFRNAFDKVIEIMKEEDLNVFNGAKSELYNKYVELKAEYFDLKNKLSDLNDFFNKELYSLNYLSDEKKSIIKSKLKSKKLLQKI